MALFTNQASLNYNGGVLMSSIVTGQLLDVLCATKTPVNDVYTGNGSVVFVISIVNTGTTALSGLTITDNLGAYDFGATTLTPLTYVPDSLVYYVNGIEQTAPTITANTPCNSALLSFYRAVR